MSSYDDIQSAKSAIDQVNAAATKIDEYAQAAKKLSDAGKTLNSAQKALKGVKMFGKLSTSLAMANIGLDVALMAFGLEAEDPNALIMKAIDALDSKVDGLWTEMESQFERVHGHMDKNQAESNIGVSLDFFVEINDLLKDYREKPTVSTALTDDRFRPSEIRHHLHTISHALSQDAANKNPLVATDVYYVGAYNDVLDVANRVVEAAIFAPFAYSLVAALRHKKDPVKHSMVAPEEVEFKLQHHVDEIVDTSVAYLELLEKPEVFNKNMKARLGRDLKSWINIVGESGKPNPGDNLFHKPVLDVHNALTHAFPFLNIVVVIGQGSIMPINVYVKPGSIFETQQYHAFNTIDIGQHYTALVYWEKRREIDDRYVSGNPKDMMFLRNMYSSSKVFHGYSTPKTYLYDNGASGYYESVYKSGNLGQQSVPDIAVYEHKDTAWSSRATDPGYCTYWLYPTWNPISDPYNPGNQIDIEHIKGVRSQCLQSKEGDDGIVGLMLRSQATIDNDAVHKEITY